MKTKTFKIGEYCIGGIIKVIIKNDKINILCLDYYTKKEINNENFNINDIYSIDDFLNVLTSCYYSDKIINYIKNI